MFERVTVIVPHPDPVYGNRVLLVREADDLFILPGGGVGLGETPEDAAHRNLHETTGLKAREMRPLFDFGGKLAHHQVFEAVGVSGIPRPLGGVVEFEWFPPGWGRNNIYSSMIHIMTRWVSEYAEVSSPGA